MKQYFLSLSKDITLYGTGFFLARALSLILVYFLTNVLTPTQFGTIELFALIMGLSSSLLVMGLDTAQTYFFYNKHPDDPAAQVDVVSSVLGFHFSYGAALALAFYVIGPDLNEWLLDGTLTQLQLALIFAIAYVNAYNNHIINLLRVMNQVLPYTLMEIAQSTLLLGLSITFIIWLKWGLQGYLAAFLCSSLTVMGYGLHRISRYLSLEAIIVRRSLRALLAFALPLVPGSMIAYLANTVDRWVILQNLSVEELAFYALAVKVTLIVGAGLTVFRRVWLRYGLEAIRSRAGLSFFQQTFLLYLHLGLLAAVLLHLLAPAIVPILAPVEYSSAQQLIGLLAIGLICKGAYDIFWVFAIMKSEKTFWLSMYPMVTTFFNLALSLALVHRFGAAGVAFATGFAFFLQSMAVMFQWRSQLEIQLPTRVMILLYLTALMATLALNEAHSDNEVLAGLIITTLLLIYGASYLYWHKRLSRTRTPAQEPAE